MTPLLSPLNPVTHEPHTWTSQATDINDAGWVSGWYWSIWGYRALVWAPDGTVSDIAGSPSENSYAQSINNAGQVVGFVDPHAQGVRRYAFLAGPNRSFTNLNDALPAGSGWQLTEAFDINNRGEIVGRGVHDGQARAFLLTTVPAPTPRAAPAALSVASASGMPPSRRESPATGAPGSVTPGVPRVDTWLGVSLRAATAPLPRETATESLRSGTGVL
jgi:hypothetical protein